MLLKSGTRRISEGERHQAGLHLRLMIASVLAIAMFGMVGCKSGSEGNASSSGGSGSGGSGSSGGAGGASSAGDFEGVVNMKMDSGGKAFQMTYYLKPDRVRTETSVPEMPDGQSVMIMDLPEAKMMTLMPKQKSYLTMDLKELRGTVGQGKDEKFPKITATGKKETVAGYTCEHYLMGDEENMDLCIAKGLGYFGMGGGSGSGLRNLMFSSKMKEEAAASPEWAKLLDGGAFPLKMTMTEGGKNTMNAEVTSVERKKLDDSLFTVPADYKEMKMPTGIPMPPVPKKADQ